MLYPIRFLSAGESHGLKLTVIIEGVPAGFKIDIEQINEDLKRRQQGFGRSARMKIEKDQALISSGLYAGKSTGAPIAIEILNQDFLRAQHLQPSLDYTAPRPGHADLTGFIKYQHPKLFLSAERASARETAMRVCVGSICKQILQEWNIQIGGYVRRIGPLLIQSKTSKVKKIKTARTNDLALPNLDYYEKAKDTIFAAMKAKDTIGGVVEICALNVPIGLGSYVHWEHRLEAQISYALMSIPAVKGVEIGPAFANSKRFGTQVHDEITVMAAGPDFRQDDSIARAIGNHNDASLRWHDGSLDCHASLAMTLLANNPNDSDFHQNDHSLDPRFRGNDNSSQIKRTSNRAGGIEGGISNGEPIVARIAMKPINTTLKALKTVDLETMQNTETTYQRSDFCAVPRLVPIAESMMAIVICNALLRKTGGDNYNEIMNRLIPHT